MEGTFTASLMRWAGLDRTERMQRAGFLQSLSVDLDGARTLGFQTLEDATKGGALRNGRAITCKCCTCPGGNSRLSQRDGL